MSSETASAPRSRWRRITSSPWFHLVLAFVLVGGVLSFVAKPYSVPSSSMTQTLQVGDRVLVNRLAYVGTEPATGDIIVFDADETWGATGVDEEPWFTSVLRWLGEVSGFGPSGPHTLVKRVIAGPGQTAACCTAAGAVTVDGVALDEPYVFNDLPFTPGVLDCETEPASTRCFGPVEVPERSYLMLGDNRGNSSDSAARCRSLPTGSDGCWRWATRDGVVGKVVSIVWPIPRWQVP
ncbi:hypothetical protein GCM10025768_07280 [Microbacterium pseudoresistens]|uniref:Signal peptidase I n=1 Tax=Microbacterium pseudoresistens TaxID=640634 RepID=A0A7Y9EVF8_9MICO|nr:signal peptidase I [Microbacterium pseudoresistens]NYD54566.1 signal peptidase I [Microbacterium pseudoresistens]